MNRAQQAYYMEKSNTFAPPANFGDLGLGIATQTANYKYAIAGGGNGAAVVTNQAQQLVNANSPLKAYLGGVAIATIAGTGEATTLAVLCEANKAPVNGGANGTQVIVAGAAGVAPVCIGVGTAAGYDPIK